MLTGIVQKQADPSSHAVENGHKGSLTASIKAFMCTIAGSCGLLTVHKQKAV
jgi:hypothetical protein